MRSVESEGDSIDDAITKALGTLQVERDRVEIEILADAQRGVFGFGGRKARVRATLRPRVGSLSDVSREASASDGASGGEVTGSTSATADRAREVVERILTHLGVSCTVMLREAAEPGTILLAVSGEESGLVIGRRGQTLDALEYLVNREEGRGSDAAGRVVVDVERYRERRRESLEQLARRLAEKAKQTGRVVTLNPMSPRDRRVVHLTLQDDAGVTTRSQGEGHYRKVLVLPSSGSPRRPER